MVNCTILFSRKKTSANELLLATSSIMFPSRLPAIIEIVLLTIILTADIDYIHCQRGGLYNCIIVCNYKMHSSIMILIVVIMTGPQTQVVAPGETAYFNCHARGDSVYWYVNRTYPHPQADYIARGFNFFYDEIPRPSNELEEHNNTITLEARPMNNYTLITCTASGHIHGQQDFQEGYLIIAGRDYMITYCMVHIM